MLKSGGRSGERAAFVHCASLLAREIAREAKGNLYGRRPNQACAKRASHLRKMAPGEREHSDPKGHAGPSAATRPVQERHPGTGQ